MSNERTNGRRRLAAILTLVLLGAPAAHGDDQASRTNPPAPTDPSHVDVRDVLAPERDRPALSQQQIRSLLEKLADWPGVKSYSGPILCVLGPEIRLSERYASNLGEIRDNPKRFYPYGSLNDNLALTLVAPSALTPLGNDGLCVVVDGFGSPIPVAAADVYNAAFANGLVGRLILGRYTEKMARAGARAADLDWGRRAIGETMKKGLPPAFVDLASYKPDPAAPDAINFKAGLERLLADHSIEGVGVLAGWAFGSDLLDLPESDQVHRDVVNTLIANRFSAADQGRMLGYVLCYLDGYAKVAQARATEPTAVPVRDPALILAQIGDDPAGMDRIASLFGDLFLAEFVAYSQNDSMAAEQKTILLQRYASFLKGYQSGMSGAADTMFKEVFRVSYNLGYLEGFRSGYERGYAAGKADGYAAGYSEAWREANLVIDSLRAELEHTQRELAEERDGDFFSDLLGFANDVIGVVEDAIPVITAVLGIL
jgi:hypothetical protein